MKTLTLHEINIIGIQALKKVLTPIELVRFFQQYEMGNGNYTEERKEKYKDYTLEQIYSEIKNKKNLKKKSNSKKK